MVVFGVEVDDLSQSVLPALKQLLFVFDVGTDVRLKNYGLNEDEK